MKAIVGGLLLGATFIAPMAVMKLCAALGAPLEVTGAAIGCVAVVIGWALAVADVEIEIDRPQQW